LHFSGVLAGTGTQNAASATNDSPACVTVFDVDNLASTGHTVLVANTGTTGQFLTVDGITLQVAVGESENQWFIILGAE